MQTLRKKTSPLKYKNETSRFMGEGVSFKAKLIGILEVSEARGDKMCQEALCDLKMAIRAAGEHKQRITITIALDGLRLRDEKTGDSLYHHPVHKISFIAQDMTDSRAFGYIFGSPDTGHRFFGIKTDKAASQVVIAMRDLFQVVFALKKKEIELAKQHLEKNSSPLFSDTSSSYSKLQMVPHVSIKSTVDSKAESSANDSKSGTAVADLVDLELELNSLQQGLNQMERITPMDPFGSKDDPFGDSFISYPAKPILPPPPSSGRDRSSRTSESSSVFSPKTPHTASATDRKDFSFSQEDQARSEWFATATSGCIFEDPSPLPGIEPTKDEKHEIKKQEIMSQFDVFTELDPLELKNPPKKALNELVQEITATTTTASGKSPETKVFSIDPFGEDPFVKDDPFADSDFSKQDPFETEFSGFRFESMKGLEAAPPPPPPPLPPKKHTNDLLNVKPPPRPPYTEDFQRFESHIEQEKSPPLPAPQRKTKFDIKPLVEEDYLTPIAFPEKNLGPTLPPPQRSTRSKPSDPLGSSLDITLSQLTLSGLNELAQKLNIPPGQLSNMTLVQLTSFLSKFMKEDHPNHRQKEEKKDNEFQADFAANFDNGADSATPYDRYAVFRELIQEEIKQTKIDSEPEEILEGKVEPEVVDDNADLEPVLSQETIDKYAALREIVEKELKMEMEKEEEGNEPEEDEDERKILNGDANEEDAESVDVINKKNEVEASEEVEKPISPLLKNDIIEYAAIEGEIVPKNDVQAGNARPTSGSLSDVVSESSPEVDITASNSDAGKKTEDVTGESWAIFDQTTVLVDSSKEKQALQSEEGVSPWSSDSKEFPNGSPPDWKSKDSGSGTDQWPKRRKEQEGWWDTSAEPEAHYCSSNRRSTDSYDEEYYECYDKPRRRRQPGNWHQAAGGHSSSSRDVSPWEEEPRRPQNPQKDQREIRGGYRHSRGPSFDRHRDRRVTDSWDEDEDYEYEEEDRRFHWPERHTTSTTREHENDRWSEDWIDERRHRRRRAGDPRDRWCCPDWDQEDHDKARYGSGRWSNPEHAKWRERYYSRESQESPWEDEYANDSEQSPYYLSTAKRNNWKQRPSSASEMDRKTGEIKSRHFLGGSDGERDRRHKTSRRSRSRDSQYSEPASHRHKADPGPISNRIPHRNKTHSHPKPLEPEKPSIESATVPTMKETLKKTSSLTRKKAKETKGEEATSTLPRKSANRFNFDNDIVDPLRPIKPLGVSPTSLLDRQRSSRHPLKSKSLFEDDFSPGDKQDDHIASIKEEEDDFTRRNFANFNRKKILSKNRSLVDNSNLKKSESVNIFAREDDPFDDDFFCGEHVEEEDEEEEESRRGTELRWTDDFKN